MPVMRINLEGDNAWPDLLDKSKVVVLGDGDVIDVAVLDGGMASGHPSVTFRFTLPDGQTVLAQTSARLFCSLGRMVTSRYPNLFED